MHGRRGQLLRVWEGMGGGQGGVGMRVLGDHHDHHGVVGQDPRGVGGHVGGLGHAMVVRALGGVTVLAGGGRAMAAPQAAAGRVFRFATTAGARVGPTPFYRAARRGLLSPANGAARAFVVATPFAFAPGRPTAPTP